MPIELKETNNSFGSDEDKRRKTDRDKTGLEEGLLEK
jgi:hypothetical protein